MTDGVGDAVVVGEGSIVGAVVLGVVDGGEAEVALFAFGGDGGEAECDASVAGVDAVLAFGESGEGGLREEVESAVDPEGVFGGVSVAGHLIDEVGHEGGAVGGVAAEAAPVPV